MDNSFVDQSLAARFEDTQAWRAVYYAQANLTRFGGSDGAVMMVAGAPVIYGGAGVPVNRAVGLGMHGPVTDDDLDTIEAFYNQRKADTVIDFCPLADPSLLPLLQARGYTIRNWMSMLFMPLPSEPVDINSAIRVSRATRDQAELWLATSARGFDDSDEIAGATLHILTPNFYASNAYCYFAWLGESAIATGALYPYNGVAELGGASTLVAHRRQGAQSTLIQQRLSDAQNLGCDLVTVLTTAGNTSQRNMQRRGFQLAYTPQSWFGRIGLSHSFP